VHRCATRSPDPATRNITVSTPAEKKIDAVYTHDDDMAMGVMQAIKAANREDEMFVTGAGGSKDAMNLIAQGGLYRATFLYNPSMSGSAVSLAKLIAEKKGLSELVEPDVPSRIELPATTVTKENVAAVQNLGYSRPEPRGLRVARHYWSLMVVRALACAIPHRPVIVLTASAVRRGVTSQRGSS
jgi:Periplasmic binding protein domain